MTAHLLFNLLHGFQSFQVQAIYVTALALQKIPLSALSNRNSLPLASAMKQFQRLEIWDEVVGSCGVGLHLRPFWARTPSPCILFSCVHTLVFNHLLSYYFLIQLHAEISGGRASTHMNWQGLSSIHNIHPLHLQAAFPYSKIDSPHLSSPDTFSVPASILTPKSPLMSSKLSGHGVEIGFILKQNFHPAMNL